MLKGIITILTVVGSFILIIIGQIYWGYKIDNSVQKAVLQSSRSDSVKAENNQEDERKKRLMAYTNNLPSEIQNKIEKNLTEGKPIRFVIVGSEATSATDEGWPRLLTEALYSAYGQGVFSVTVKEYSGITTVQAVEDKIFNEIIELKPDLLLLEPFILNNNGVLSIERTLEDLTNILAEVRSAVPDVMVMLQPAHPIYNARHYPSQVTRLKKYAEENNYIYLDHWRSWPDYKSREIQNYLSEDQNVPNQAGHRLWANFLINYFVAKPEKKTRD